MNELEELITIIEQEKIEEEADLDLGQYAFLIDSGIL